MVSGFLKFQVLEFRDCPICWSSEGRISVTVHCPHHRIQRLARDLTHRSNYISTLRIVVCLPRRTTQSLFRNSPKQSKNLLGKNRVPSMFITRESDQKPISNHCEASSTTNQSINPRTILDVCRTLYEASVIRRFLSHVPTTFHDREQPPKSRAIPNLRSVAAVFVAVKTVSSRASRRGPSGRNREKGSRSRPTLVIVISRGDTVAGPEKAARSCG